jgi:hypothetical protein
MWDDERSTGDEPIVAVAPNNYFAVEWRCLDYGWNVNWREERNYTGPGSTREIAIHYGLSYWPSASVWIAPGTYWPYDLLTEMGVDQYYPGYLGPIRKEPQKSP